MCVRAKKHKKKATFSCLPEACSLSNPITQKRGAFTLVTYIYIQKVHTGYLQILSVIWGESL